MARVGSYPLIVGMVGMGIGALFGASVAALALGGPRSENEGGAECVCAGEDTSIEDVSPVAAARRDPPKAKAPPLNVGAPGRPALTVLEAPLAFPGGSPALGVGKIKTRLITALRTLAAGASDVHGVECGQYPCLAFLEMDGSVLTALEGGGFGTVSKAVGDGAALRFGEHVVRPELMPVETEAGTLLRHIVAVPLLEDGAVELSPTLTRTKLRPRIDDYFYTVPRAFNADDEGAAEP